MGHELVGRERTLQVWQVLIESPAASAVVVEADQPVGGSRVVGFGCGVFVSEDFAARELADPRPGVSARVIESLVTGKSALLSRKQVGQGNSGAGLDFIILYSVLRTDPITGDPSVEHLNRMFAAVWQTLAGYRFRVILREAVGEANIRHVEWQKVFRRVSDYGEFHSRNPGNSWGRDRVLFTMDESDASAVAGSLYHVLFQYREPVLRFRGAEQEILKAALGGLTDEELAIALRLKLTTVKKRWASILDRVRAIKPDLVPGYDQDGEVRGRQKRHHLIAYLREHLEELRPMAYPRRGAVIEKTGAADRSAMLP